MAAPESNLSIAMACLVMAAMALSTVQGGRTTATTAAPQQQNDEIRKLEAHKKAAGDNIVGTIFSLGVSVNDLYNHDSSTITNSILLMS